MPENAVGHPSTPPKDHSETNPRDALLGALTRAIDGGIATGDLELVRIAVDTLAVLAGRTTPQQLSLDPVVREVVSASLRAVEGGAVEKAVQALKGLLNSGRA